MSLTTDSRLGCLVLAASTVVSSYIILLVGYVLPPVFAALYRLETLSQLDVLLSPVTKFAVQYEWAFASASCFIFAVAVILVRCSPARVLQFVTVGLCVQALVVWVAMFCFFYGELCGPISMHHPPWFNWEYFFKFAFAVFPVSLCAIVIPGFFALRSSATSRPCNSPAGNHPALQ